MGVVGFCGIGLMFVLIVMVFFLLAVGCLRCVVRFRGLGDVCKKYVFVCVCVCMCVCVCEFVCECL